MKESFKAFENLYEKYSSAVFRFAWGLTGDPNHAEDIVSETFVRVLTKAPKLETETALAYLLAVARNTFLSEKRRRRREVPISDGHFQTETGSVLEDIQTRDRLKTVFGALSQLPESERAALLLRVDHNLAYPEIASVLGASIGAVRVRVHRARMHLLEAIKSERI